VDANHRLIRRVTAEDIRPLRHSVLRPGQAFLETRYPGDDAGLHFGAFDGDRLVGIASLYEEGRADGPAGGWRLRGMATDPDVRGAGYGAALLAACVEEVVSEEFDVPGIGPHLVMARRV
jgi:GNAT superfamily N-acetyltransferase